MVSEAGRIPGASEDRARDLTSNPAWERSGAFLSREGGSAEAGLENRCPRFGRRGWGISSGVLDIVDSFVSVVDGGFHTVEFGA